MVFFKALVTALAVHSAGWMGAASTCMCTGRGSMSRKKASDARSRRNMLASRVRRHLAKLLVEARPVPCDQGDVEGDDNDPFRRKPILSAAAERSKIETIFGKLLPLMPRGRKIRILDLCNGESTLQRRWGCIFLRSSSTFGSTPIRALTLEHCSQQGLRG